jgi:hypothetical protein
LQSVIEIASLGDGQDRAEHFLLKEAGFGIDIGDDRGLDEKAGAFRDVAAGD